MEKTEQVMASGLMGQNTYLFRGASSLILCFAFGSSLSIQSFGDGLGTSGTPCGQRQAHKFLSRVLQFCQTFIWFPLITATENISEWMDSD